MQIEMVEEVKGLLEEISDNMHDRFSFFTVSISNELQRLNEQAKSISFHSDARTISCFTIYCNNVKIRPSESF